MSERATGVSAGGGTAAHSGVTGGLFARPVLEADRRGDGSWLLRSAVPLAEPDPCVLTSVRRWASAGPDYPLIAERDPQGAGGPGPAATSSGFPGDVPHQTRVQSETAALYMVTTVPHVSQVGPP